MARNGIGLARFGPAVRLLFACCLSCLAAIDAAAAEKDENGIGREFYAPTAQSRPLPPPNARVKVAIPAVGAPSFVRDDAGERASTVPSRIESRPVSPDATAVFDGSSAPRTASVPAPFAATTPVAAGGALTAASAPAGDPDREALAAGGSARAPEAKILAVVEGRKITDRELLRELWTERARETFDWMVGNALLEAELSRLGLEIADAEVDQRLREHLAGLGKIFPGVHREDDLTRAASGMGLAEYRRRSVWSELALRKIMRATIAPDDDLLRRFYAERQARYIEPDQALVAQIFIAPEPGPDAGDAAGPAEWAEAERRIAEAHGRLRFGEDFRAVATAYSSGGSGSRWIGHGELMRELDEAAFSLPAGAMSGPIKSALGYHILIVRDRKERRAPPFEEVRERLRGEYEDGLFAAAAGEFMTRLRDRALQEKRLVVEDAELAFPVGEEGGESIAGTRRPGP
ncbi:MAG: peptidyl-prolyl cis-trans isomerase [Planctomycetota bacterium]|jgi:parvulin-like peptidyl-prolyl isomerase|nr:peptidyl-prolyl cis-trans isomerase [Planctomycetota bacterium]